MTQSTQSSSSVPPLVVGFDGGGTSLRVAVADANGRIVGEAHGPGINPNSGGDPEPALTQTLAAALSSVSPADRGVVIGGVAGLAGVVTNPVQLNEAARAAWLKNGIEAPLEVVSDLVVAFWSGVARSALKDTVDEGLVLIAGTGAVAALVRGSELVATIDGYGYLLGDRGGGVWLGIRGAQAALDGASGRGPATVLTDLVLRDRTPTDFIASQYQRAPREVGQYARSVDEAAGQGDVVALQIVDEAVLQLRETVNAVASGKGPIVLVGSVAAGNNSVGSRLRNRLELDGYEVLLGGAGTVGAITLAARAFGGTTPPVQ